MLNRFFNTLPRFAQLRHFMLFSFLLCLISALLTLTSQHLSAATSVVTNTNDDGVGSLRQAIAVAAPGDTIVFDASLSGQTIILSTMLSIEKNLTIDGSALPNAITLSGNERIRVMRVAEGAVVMLTKLVIADGEVGGLPPVPFAAASALPNDDFSKGAGLLNDGIVIIEQLTFSNNRSYSYKFSGGDGGAIINNHILTITNSSLSNNSAGIGGGILNHGSLIVDNSTFAHNIASNGGWGAGFGGAIFNTAILTVTNSTFSMNSAYGGLGGASNGGAISNGGEL